MTKMIINLDGWALIVIVFFSDVNPRYKPLMLHYLYIERPKILASHPILIQLPQLKLPLVLKKDQPGISNIHNMEGKISWCKQHNISYSHACYFARRHRYALIVISIGIFFFFIFSGLVCALSSLQEKCGVHGNRNARTV